LTTARRKLVKGPVTRQHQPGSSTCFCWLNASPPEYAKSRQRPSSRRRPCPGRRRVEYCRHRTRYSHSDQLRSMSINRLISNSRAAIHGSLNRVAKPSLHRQFVPPAPRIATRTQQIPDLANRAVIPAWELVLPASRYPVRRGALAQRASDDISVHRTGASGRTPSVLRPTWCPSCCDA